MLLNVDRSIRLLGVAAVALATHAVAQDNTERSAGRSSPAAMQTAPPPLATAAVPLVFRDVTVVDVAAGRLVPGQMVVVIGMRVQSVGPAGTLPAGAQVIDGRGKYLLPGFWDMHVHSDAYADVYYPLLIANGVTGMRDMGTAFLEDELRYRREVRAGARVGPRVVTAGPLLHPAPLPLRLNTLTPAVEVRTAADGRRLVDSLQAAGVDFIKVYAPMPRDVWFAIAAEARRIGIPFAGHESPAVPTLVASDSGQHSIEHVSAAYGLYAPCLSDSATVERCRTVAEHLARNDTWFTPTLMAGTAPEGRAILHSYTSHRDELFQYWPDSLLHNASRTIHIDRQQAQLPRDEVAFLQELLATTGPSSTRAARAKGATSGLVSRGRLAVAAEAGLPILAGTDAMPRFTLTIVPGFSLQMQLALLAKEGLGPLGALQAATLNPAKYFHATDSLGAVVTGKLADLVLLDANPLDDIRNTEKIHAVVANGHYYDRAALDQLLLAVRRRQAQTLQAP